MRNGGPRDEGVVGPGGGTGREGRDVDADKEVARLVAGLGSIDTVERLVKHNRCDKTSKRGIARWHLENDAMVRAIGRWRIAETLKEVRRRATTSTQRQKPIPTLSPTEEERWDRLTI